MNNILKIIIYPIWLILNVTIIIPLIVRFITGLSWNDVRDEYEDFLDD
jgi:hypothetical protein